MTIANLFPLLQVAAQSVSEVVQVATRLDMNQEMGVLAGQIPVAFWVVWFMEHLKKSKYCSWVNTVNSGNINRVLGMLGALFSSAGINWAIQGTVLAGGTITITLPAIGHLVHFVLFDLARSYGVQQMFFKVLSRSSSQEK